MLVLSLSVSLFSVSLLLFILFLLDKAEAHSTQPPPPFLRSTSQPGTPIPPTSSDGVEPMQVDSAHPLGKTPDGQGPPPPTPTESEAKQMKPPTTPGSAMPLPSGGVVF